MYLSSPDMLLDALQAATEASGEPNGGAMGVWREGRGSKAFVFLLCISWCCMVATTAGAQTGAWPTHSHDEQHTGVSSVAGQTVSKIHWHVPVDLAPPNGEIFIHYGSPLVTAANTVIVPVKTATGFRVEGHNGATGKKMWTQATKYQA